MRQMTQTISIYRFEELPENIRQKVIGRWREHDEFFGHEENLASIKHFADQFGVKLTDWLIGDRGSNISTNAENDHFRSLKLKEASKLNLSDGLWIGEDMRDKFLSGWKEHGSALVAFKDAIESARQAWESDLEYWHSEESILEAIEAGDYEFLKNGDIH